MQDLKEVIWSLTCDKSLGPDGFTMVFFKASWDIIKNDLLEGINEFLLHANIPKSISPAFISLIPKNQHPQEHNDYCPICLIRKVYIIISMFLVGRLNKVFDTIVSKIQSTFILNRNMLDEVLVINELVDYARRNRHVCFQSQIRKIFWLLFYVLKRMNFGHQWTK